MKIHSFRQYPISALFFGVALLCILLLVLSHSVAIPLQFPPYKTIPDFPALMWIALVSTVLGLLYHFVVEEYDRVSYTLFIVVLLVVLFYGLIPASESVLRWHDSWLHARIASAIIENGHTDPTTWGYHSWPGFFYCIAQVGLVTGIDLNVLAQFFHVLPNVLAILIVFLFFKRLGLGESKAALLGVVVFIVADDRIYYHISPMNFSFALFLVFLYFSTIRFNRRAFWGISTVLLFANVISHFFTPLYLFAFFLFLWVAEHVFSLPSEHVPRYFNVFIIGFLMWIGWSFYVVDVMWWRYGMRVLPSIEARMTGYAPMLRYAPTYWRWTGSTFYVESFRAIILGTVIALAGISILIAVRNLRLIGVSRSSRLRLKLRMSLDRKGWFFIVLMCLILAIITAGVLPFVALRETMGFADRFLLFIWIPLAFFAAILVAKSGHGRIKKLLTVLLIALIIPAFIDFHWHEFWLSTHQWEVDATDFVKAYGNYSSVFLTDSGTAWLTRAIVTFDLNYRIEEMGMRGFREKEGDALLVFNGTMSPLAIDWDYLLRSEKGEVRLNLYYGIPLSTSKNLDTALSNNPLLNRIYDSSYYQIYKNEAQNVTTP